MAQLVTEKGLSTALNVMQQMLHHGYATQYGTQYGTHSGFSLPMGFNKLRFRV